jgi:hypothetical protein
LTILTQASEVGVPADRMGWNSAFTAIYQEKRRQKQEHRQRRRVRRREPSAEALAARETRLAEAQARIEARYAEAQQRPGFIASFWKFVEFLARSGDSDAKRLWRAASEPILAEQRRVRQAQRREEVRLRLSLGFRWPGGLVAGNPAYARAPLAYAGLVSEEHPLLRLFVASTPRASRLQTGDTKARVDRVGQKLLALDSPYVVTSRTMGRVLRVELDRAFAGGFAELADAITACSVPLPNLAVGYLDPAGRLLNPHLIWLIEHAVVLTGKGRRNPQKLWRAVLDGLTAGLLPIGADPGGRTNALRMKNPLSPLWDRRILVPAPYTLTPDTRDGTSGLAALTPALNLNDAREQLRVATGDHQGRPLAADHPDPAIAGQSNALFLRLIPARINLDLFQSGACRGQEWVSQNAGRYECPGPQPHRMAPRPGERLGGRAVPGVGGRGAPDRPGQPCCRVEDRCDGEKRGALDLAQLPPRGTCALCLTHGSAGTPVGWAGKGCGIQACRDLRRLR